MYLTIELEPYYMIGTRHKSQYRYKSQHFCLYSRNERWLGDLHRLNDFFLNYYLRRPLPCSSYTSKFLTSNFILVQDEERSYNHCFIRGSLHKTKFLAFHDLYLCDCGCFCQVRRHPSSSWIISWTFLLLYYHFLLPWIFRLKCSWDSLWSRSMENWQ